MEKLKRNSFQSNLVRSFKDLKAAKASAVAEDAELSYKRKIEDICKEIRVNERSREEDILNLSPESTIAPTAIAKSFNPTLFVEKDLEIGTSNRQLCICLEILLDRYQRLFGPYADTASINEVLPDWKPYEFED